MKLALFSLVTSAIAFSLGLWIGNEKRVLSCAADEPKLTKTCPVPATALMQWTCGAQERREYLHACATRLRLGNVKGRE